MNAKKKADITLYLLCFILGILGGIVVITFNDDSSNMTQTQTVTINEPIQKKDLINLNTATKEELKSLNGIGDVLAERIILNRPYKSVWDLSEIKGIGQDTIEQIISEVSTE